MKDNKSFYITTTLPYVNSELHVGHATELIRADAIARYKKLHGFEVYFNSGTDEHGTKIKDAAENSGQSPQKHVDFYAEKFKQSVNDFGLDLETLHLIRTTDSKHEIAAKKFWQICNENGYIYKKNYQRKYCSGCEEEKNDSDLVDGRCPIHENKELELIDEENYFFKYSEFGDELLKFYDDNPTFIIPDSRMNEMRSFTLRGLNDFSISRLKSKMPWGVEVPGDPDHVMYVWFDALTSYLSTLGWPDDTANFDKFWVNGNPTQYCGKDNTRFQGVMWQAMLMAAGIRNSHQIVVNGFIMGDGGVKMSKSLGNVVDPKEIVKDYGTDALRYFVLRELNPFEDSPFSHDRFKESYNSGLANGLGNLTSRIMKMAETNLDSIPAFSKESIEKGFAGVDEEIKSFNLQNALNLIWAEVQFLDQKIQETQPFKLVKVDPESGKKIIVELVQSLFAIAVSLEPFLPETSKKIQQLIKENKSPTEPLFARKD